MIKTDGFITLMMDQALQMFSGLLVNNLFMKIMQEIEGNRFTLKIIPEYLQQVNKIKLCRQRPLS